MPSTSPKNIAGKGKRQKPAKPTADFPLFPHDSGQWCKKIAGKLRYFGVWADPTAALKRYLAEKDYHLAGVEPPVNGEGLTLVKLVEEFLDAKEERVKTGELSQRTFDDYDDICRKVLKVFGAQQLVEKLKPADFGKLRATLAKKHGLTRMCKNITCTKTLFKFAYENDLIDRPVKFGSEFKRPRKVDLRKLRQRQQHERGPRMFPAEEIRMMLKAASPQLKGMILLACNCGFGNHDCESLSWKHIDGEWIDFPRPKTGVHRRCCLWPETIAALEAVKECRPEPKDPAYSDRVFITRKGNPWNGSTIRDNPISKSMAKLLDALDIRRHGVGFYGLRHGFQTIGAQARDEHAVRAIMGHAEKGDDMGAIYNEEAVSDDRLRAVADYVRHWVGKMD